MGAHGLSTWSITGGINASAIAEGGGVGWQDDHAELSLAVCGEQLGGTAGLVGGIAAQGDGALCCEGAIDLL